MTSSLDIHQQKLQNAILDLLCLAAVFHLTLNFDEIHKYLSTSIGAIPLKKALDQLIEQKIVTQTAHYYGLSGTNYPNPHNQRFRQAELMKKAKRWSKVFALLPFIKSVVVVNSTAIGNTHADSDIDLLIITKPARIYLTKGILMYGLKMLKQLETEQKKASRFSLGMFISTSGVNFKKDIMRTNNPYLGHWLVMARPFYGKDVYYNLLRKHTDLVERFPNFDWPQTKFVAYGRGMGVLDPIETIGYKTHLKHTSTQAKNHTEQAFVRVRPDIINLHALDKSTEIAEEFVKIRARYTIDSQ